MFQDQLAEHRGRGADPSASRTDPFDGPVGVAAMAGGHVLGDGGVLAVAAEPRMWAAIRSPFRKISTVRSVSRTSTLARAWR